MAKGCWIWRPWFILLGLKSKHDNNINYQCSLVATMQLLNNEIDMRTPTNRSQQTVHETGQKNHGSLKFGYGKDDGPHLWYKKYRYAVETHNLWFSLNCNVPAEDAPGRDSRPSTWTRLLRWSNTIRICTGGTTTANQVAYCWRTMATTQNSCRNGITRTTSPVSGHR